MKLIKWRILIITCFVCLLPILFGVALWDRLPQEIAIHFDFYNNPDNYASKGFAVFGLPVIMFFLQFVCCVINDINLNKHPKGKKIRLAPKWIIPVVTAVIYVVTLGYSLGWNINIRNVALIIIFVSILYVVILERKK